jgi:NADP-dependent 3-hydroxy acid dehydrogenase YdfG
MALSTFKDRVVLITGASAGIGEETARQLVAAGARVALLARRIDRMQTLASEFGADRALAIECDVNQEGGVEAAVQTVVRQWGKLDVVFANAGFSVSGEFSDLTLEDYRRQLETNVFGLIRTSYATLPELIKSKGRLVLVGSVAAYLGLPSNSAYVMSKAAVRGFADSITPELAKKGVSVTLISTGFVTSEIRLLDSSGKMPANAKDPVPAWLQVPTSRGVREILQAVDRRKREQIITGFGKVFVYMQRYCPSVMRRLSSIEPPNARKSLR